MKRFDDFLIGRVFQPTANALAGRATPADAARFFLTGAMVLLLARMMVSASVELPKWTVVFDFAALSGSMVLLRVLGVLANARTNPLRDQLGRARPFMAVLTILVWIMGATSLDQGLAAMQLALLSAALYFASCDAPTSFRPRMPRRGAVARAVLL